MEEGSGDSNTAKWALIGGVGLPIVGVIGFCVWFFGIRDTWELDHHVEIVALADETASFARVGKAAEATASNEKLSQLLNGRVIQDQALKTAIEDATSATKTAVAKAAAAKAEEERRKAAAEAAGKITAARDRLKSLITAEKWEEAVKEGTAAVAAGKILPQATPETTAALAEIATAMPTAQAGWDKVKKEQAAAREAAQQEARDEAQKAAIEKRVREAAEKELARQAEEDAKNAKYRATVSGGAWVVKGAGNSDVLRGLKIYILKPECNAESVRACLLSIAETAKSDAKGKRQTALEYRAKKDDFYDKQADKYEAEAAELDKCVAAVNADAAKITTRMNTLDAYKLILKADHSSPLVKKYGLQMPLGGSFAKVLTEVTEKTAQTNIEGKYTFDAIAGGRHYVYAYWSTDISSIEWIIPITVKDAPTVSQDLFNENAEVIWNKKS